MNQNYEAIQTILNKIESGIYSINENGNLYHIKKDKRLGSIDKDGYIRYFSTFQSGRRTVCGGHRVAFAHYHGLDELKKYETVNHIDGNKLNNSKGNLEGISASENVIHQWRTGLGNRSIPVNMVRKIRTLFREGYSIRSISNHYKIKFNSVQSIVSNASYTNDYYYNPIEIELEDRPKYKTPKGNRRLEDDDIFEIRKMIAEGFSYNKIIGAKGVERHTISRINTGKYLPLCELDSNR